MSQGYCAHLPRNQSPLPRCELLAIKLELSPKSSSTNTDTATNNAGSSHRRKKLTLLVLDLTAPFVVFYGPTDNRRWDPSYYYAQVHSPLIDRDLDFRNETDTGQIETKVTVTDLQHSPYLIGPSILWSPHFVGANIFTLAFRQVSATGFSAPYITNVSLGPALYGLLGIYVVYLDLTPKN
jgi:hypothetical protein